MNRKVKSYLLGNYNKFSIINLYYTNFQLKILLNLIIKLASTNQQIFFLKSQGFFKNKDLSIPNKNLYIYDYKWIFGFITNFKCIKTHWAERVKAGKKLDDKALINLNAIQFFPSLIIFFDNFNYDAVKEASIVGIPTAGIINTDFKYMDLLNYPIISNNSSQNILYLYYDIFLNAINKGIQNEHFNVLSLK